MIRRWFQALPGPLPVRLLIAFVIVAIVVALLAVVFERAGDLIDTGGVVGPGQ